MGVFVEHDARSVKMASAWRFRSSCAWQTALSCAAAIFDFAEGKVALFQGVMDRAATSDSERHLRGTTLSPQPLMTLVLAAPQTAALDEHRQREQGAVSVGSS